jgi:hypothetical protein
MAGAIKGISLCIFSQQKIGLPTEELIRLGQLLCLVTRIGINLSNQIRLDRPSSEYGVDSHYPKGLA